MLFNRLLSFQKDYDSIFAIQSNQFSCLRTLEREKKLTRLINNSES